MGVVVAGSNGVGGEWSAEVDTVVVAGVNSVSGKEGWEGAVGVM